MNAFSASIRLSTGKVRVSSTSSRSSSGLGGTVAGFAVLRFGFGDRAGPATGVEVFVSTGVVSARVWLAGEGLAIAAGVSDGCDVGLAAAGLSVGNGDALGVGVAVDRVSDGCAVGVAEGAGRGVSTTETLGVGCATGDSLGVGDGVSFNGGAGLPTTRGRVSATRFSGSFWSSDSKVKLFRSPRVFMKVSIPDSSPGP